MYDGCEKYEYFISMLIDGEISNKDKIILSTHLDTCDVCKGYLKKCISYDDQLKKELIYPSYEKKEIVSELDLEEHVRKKILKKINSVGKKNTSGKINLQFISSVVGILVSLLGFVFIGNQVVQARKDLHASTHERLLRHNLEVLGKIIDNPEVRPFLYDNKRISRDTDPETRSKVLTFCEIFVDFFEHVSFQRPHIEEKAIVTWEKYTSSMFASSYEMRKFFRENMNWYHGDLRRMVGSSVWYCYIPFYFEVGINLKTDSNPILSW